MKDYLICVLAVLAVAAGGTIASTDAVNAVLYEGEVLGGLALVETQEADFGGLVLVLAGKVCAGFYVDGKGENERFTALINGNEDAPLLACTFEDNRLAAVASVDEARPGVLTVLAGRDKGKWGPVLYRDVDRQDDPNSEFYCDIDFDGTFDIKGRWDREQKFYGMADARIYADGKWLEVMEWAAADKVRARLGERDANYVFVPRRGWLSPAAARETTSPHPEAAPPDWIKKMFDQWKEGGAEGCILATWRDVEVWERKVKAVDKSFVEVSKGGKGIALIIRPSDFGLGLERDGDIHINILDGHTADPVVSALTDGKGIRDVYLRSEGSTGCLWLSRDDRTDAAWTAHYLATDPVTKLIKGEMYYDIGFDGRMDFKCVYDGLVREPQSRWVYLQGRWEPASDIGLSQRRGKVKRDGKEVVIEFVPGHGWKEVSATKKDDASRKP